MNSSEEETILLARLSGNVLCISALCFESTSQIKTLLHYCLCDNKSWYCFGDFGQMEPDFVSASDILKSIQDTNYLLPASPNPEYDRYIYTKLLSVKMADRRELNSIILNPAAHASMFSSRETHVLRRC